MPLNWKCANGTYPPEDLSPEVREQFPESVKFNEKGFADFSPYAKAEVEIQYTGDRRQDARLANKAAGFDRTPEGYTWHHHEDASKMQLLPEDLHDDVRHTGGCATSGLDYNK